MRMKRPGGGIWVIFAIESRKWTARDTLVAAGAAVLSRTHSALEWLVC